MVMPAMAAIRRRSGSMVARSVVVRSMIMGTVIVSITMPGRCGRCGTPFKGLGGDHQRDRHRLLQHSGDQSGEHPGNQGAREYAFEHSVQG